ncbi:hypothetical protein [Streptomyces sp. NPDC059874]|uniref:hypothetical protein n=1 Tax=Streptomyces sp. NPDC059874 TaxID=3346983 RepID=UPI00365A4A78
MRTALVRRSVLTASAVSLVLLATACGSGKADTKTDAKPSAPASSAAPAAKGKTDAELAALMVTLAEVPDYTGDATATGELADVDKHAVTTDKAECKVLVQSQAVQKIGTPTGIARQILSPKPKALAPDAPPEEQAKAIQKTIGNTMTMIGLSSYDGTGAEELLASLKAAGTACAGGFTATTDGEATKYEGVKPGPAVTGGDEVVSLAITIVDEGGDKATGQLVVVRKGATVATFNSISFLGTTESPTALIDTQVKKLG